MQLWRFARQHPCDAPGQVTVGDGGFHLHLNQTVLQFTDATTQEHLVRFEATGHGQITFGRW